MNLLVRRRSPAHDLLDHLKPNWGEVQGMAVALSFKSPETEGLNKKELALCDFSFLPRTGFKGPQTLTWLEQAGIQVPGVVYEHSRWNSEGLIIRIDRQEVFLEDGPGDDGVAWLAGGYPSNHSDVYRIERQDASFLLSGAKANKVLVETCGYDFRHAAHRLVLTRVAGVSCALLPLEMTGVPGFRIWLDSSYGAYLWEALYEIVRDHGGDAVGIACFYPNLFK